MCRWSARSAQAWWLVAAFLMPVAAGAQSTPPSERALRESLLARDRAVTTAVRREGLAGALAGALAPDGMLLLDAVPVAQGRDAVQRVLAARADLAGLVIEWQPIVAHLAPDGTLGVTLGFTRARGASAGDSAAITSNYISVWRRQGEGWTLVAHVENGLPHEAGPLAVQLPAAARATMTSAAAAFAGADSAFARMAQDSGAAAAFAAFATPTAVTFGHSGDLAVGPSAIRARLSERRVRSRWAWAPIAAGASEDGTVGFTVGESAITIGEGAGAITYFGHYLTAWQRMPDGAIRFLADAGSSRPAPPGAPGALRVDAAGIEQVWVPSGSFRMGTPETEARELASQAPAWVGRALPSESPAHNVRLTRGYWIDRYEVTNAAFQAFVDAGGYRNRALWSAAGWQWLRAQDTTRLRPCGDVGPDHPRACVTWFEAEAYAAWRHGRLPTEAEWEYAARGSASRRYPWGDAFDSTLCNVVSSTTSVRVGSFPGGVSWVGAEDMAGNVMEWVRDWLDPGYYARSGPDDPTGPATGRVKVEKGGWWGSNPIVARAAYRHYEDPPTYADHHIGFRIASAGP